MDLGGLDVSKTKLPTYPRHLGFLDILPEVGGLHRDELGQIRDREGHLVCGISGRSHTKYLLPRLYPDPRLDTRPGKEGQELPDRLIYVDSETVAEEWHGVQRRAKGLLPKLGELVVGRFLEGHKGLAVLFKKEG